MVISLDPVILMTF